MNTDERRAMRIVKDKYPERADIVFEFTTYLRTNPSNCKKPEEIAKDFISKVILGLKSDGNKTET